MIAITRFLPGSRRSHVGGAIASLLSRGVNENDIVLLSSLLNSHPKFVGSLLSGSKVDTDVGGNSVESSGPERTRRDENAPLEPRDEEAEKTHPDVQSFLDSISGIISGRSDTDKESD